MVKLRSLFPNMDALIVFEAAARLSSFSQAAKELNVTASAVSQQIKGLEQTLEVRLFVRTHRSVKLTQTGKDFRNSVSVAIMHLSNAASELSDDKKLQQINIATDTSIAKYWLMPRVEKLKKKFPNKTFRIYVSDEEKNILKSDFQFAILHGPGRWQGLESRLLFKEEIYPVCSPSYLYKFGSSINYQILMDADLLDLEYENWDWMNWTIWLTEKGLPSAKLSRKIVSNNYPLLIDAAKRGLGFALAWRKLHENDLTSGSLVAPFSQSVKTKNGYHLTWPYNNPANDIDLSIREWLLAEEEKPNNR